MRNATYPLIAALALLLGLQAKAQEKEKNNHFSIDIQMLSRGEIRDGGMSDQAQAQDGTPISDHCAFLLGRTRVALEYTRPHIQIRAVPQHAAIWGQGDAGSLAIYEAWAKFTTNNGLFAQLGRQALSYDDERIVGPDDWSMTGNTHDVLRLGYEGHGHKVHAVVAYNQNPENTVLGGSYYTGGSQPYKTMQIGWYHYDVPVFPLGASLLVMNIGMQSGERGEEDECVKWQQVLGTYVKYHPERWSVEAAYYKQMGENEMRQKIDAWMASVKASVDPSEVFGFDVGYDYLSGDDKFAVPKGQDIGLIRHTVIKGFSPVYGSHHKFYGAMDFFYVSAYLHGFSPGLQNAYISGRVKPIKNLSMGLSYHYLAITADITDQVAPTLGHEFEFQAGWNFLKDASLSVGVSYMFGTDTMKQLKRASEDGRLFWTWITLSVAPRVLNHQW